MKQRLSKLQKWILKNCYHEQNGQVYKAMMKMTNKVTKGKKVDIAVEIKDKNKTNVRIVELTDLGVEKAKELLKLSS